MERRWSLRKPVTFEVQVSHKCNPVIRGRSRNISLEGLFIETGIVILPVGAFIDVEFALLTGETWEQIRMPAVVVHRTGHGCGIMFHAFNTAVFRSIERMLYTHDSRFARQAQRIPSSETSAASARWPCRV
jgi:PilZ domain